MVRNEIWKVHFKNKILDVYIFVAYPGREITEFTTAGDRTEFDIFTVTDMDSNFLYDGTKEPFEPVPDDLMNAIINDGFLNPPQSVEVLDTFPDDDHVDADHEIIVKNPTPNDEDAADDDDEYLYDDDDEDDENDTHNRFS